MRSAVIVTAVALKKKENGWKTLLHMLYRVYFQNPTQTAIVSKIKI